MSRLRSQRSKKTRAPSEDGNGRVRIAAREESSPARSPLRVRRLLQPVPLAGVALLLVGLLVVLCYQASAGRRSAVLIAARSLPAGTVINASDLRSAEVGADPVVLSALLPAGMEASVVGRRLTASLGSGEPLPRSELAASSVSPAAFTLTVPAEHALGGTLQPGDRVTVLATFTSASGGATTHALARGLLVLAVGRIPSIGDPNQTTIPVTVALPAPAVSARLALANSVAKIDLLLDPPGSPAAPIPTASTPGAGT